VFLVIVHGWLTIIKWSDNRHFVQISWQLIIQNVL